MIHSTGAKNTRTDLKKPVREYDMAVVGDYIPVEIIHPYRRISVKYKYSIPVSMETRIKRE